MTPAGLTGPRRFGHREFSAEALARAKNNTTVSVCLPARDEARTIGQIVETIRADLADKVHLVDEVLVADDRSADATAATAAAAGAVVVPVVPSAGSRSGKGAAMTTVLAASRGDLVVFLDADIERFSSHFVVGLLGPLLSDRGIGFVKGTYGRPLAGAAGEGGGGHRAHRQAALGHAAPPSGLLRTTTRRGDRGASVGTRGLSMPPDYGVDVALLIHVARRIGLDATAEVNLGERHHRNRRLSELAPQARSVAQTILERAGIGTGAPVPRDAAALATRYQTLSWAPAGWHAGDGRTQVRLNRRSQCHTPRRPS